MDMVGRRFNVVAAGRRSAGETAGGGTGSANNAAKPAAGSNTAAADSDATASAAVEPSEIHKVPGVFDPAGRIVCGGKVDRAARYIAPTVLYGTSPDAPVMKEEIFGPILPILVVEDAESAIRFINKRSRPLAAYVFSRDHEVRLTFERQTSSGALGYSLPLGHLLSSRLPFGGVGASGIDAYHGKAGFLTFPATSKPWLSSRSSPTLCASCARPSMKRPNCSTSSPNSLAISLAGYWVMALS